jgi:2'-5' RNA ligase
MELWARGGRQPRPGEFQKHTTLVHHTGTRTELRQWCRENLRWHWHITSLNLRTSTMFWVETSHAEDRMRVALTLA